jgi:DNA (cytosine-5)-methyltransferase 1
MKTNSRNRLKDSYQVQYRILNAANYGVPQHRERLFIVGFRRDLGLNWSFPTPTHSRDVLLWTQWVSGEYWERHCVPRKKLPEMPRAVASRVKKLTDGMFGKPWRTVRDVLFDLPEPTVEGDGDMLNHKLQPGARSYPGHTGSPLDLPAKTLKAGVHGVPGGENMLRYPSGGVRYFSVRESARLQCFPDSYGFPGVWSESMRQLGNAVPVDLAQAVTSGIRKAIEKEIVQKTRPVVTSSAKIRGRRNGRKAIQSAG